MSLHFHIFEQICLVTVTHGVCSGASESAGRDVSIERQFRSKQ